MNKIILFIFINIFLLNCEEIRYNHSKKEKNLFFVLTSFRHGARNSYYETDIFNNTIEGPGLLTEYGEKQHINLGKKLRKRYFNFLNLKEKIFDKEQLYVRSSQILRTKISTLKQIESLLNTSNIDDSYIDIKNIKKSIMYLYSFNDTEIDNILEYYESCSLRELTADNYTLAYFHDHILPIYEKCFGKYDKIQRQKGFCDGTISAFFQYKYNKQKNLITKCGVKTAELFYDFCVGFLDSFRFQNEKTSYIMYVFFSHIFKYMQDAIDKKSKLKMIMIGGHDNTLTQIMNFFNGLNIVNRTEYPHYAYNIIFELREYNQDFYLEIYYNDILKYNRTLKYFKNTLDESKYSNLYNYCGVPKIKMNNTNSDDDNKNSIQEKNNIKQNIKEEVEKLGIFHNKNLIIKESIAALSFIIIIVLTIMIIIRVILYKRNKRRKRKQHTFIKKSPTSTKLII